MIQGNILSYCPVTPFLPPLLKQENKSIKSRKTDHLITHRLWVGNIAGL